MIGVRQRRFSAMLTPNGLHMVEYRRGARGLQILRYARHLTEGQTPSAAIALLAEELEREGARAGSLSLAITGLGSCHHILTLPPASREIIAPVVVRELRRFYPALFQGARPPMVNFVEIDSSGQNRSGEQQELLAAALPAELVTDLHAALAARSIQLEHLTILPRTVERLYGAFTTSAKTSAVLLLIPRAPLLGLFHEGELRLFSEPLLDHELDLNQSLDAVVEQLDRGALFLRQQFRGARLERLLVSAEPREFAELERHLADRSPLQVERFGAYGDAPGALAALGAALDAERKNGFNLLPRELRGPSVAERRTRWVGLASMAMLILAAAWWAATGLIAAHRAENALEAVENRLGVRYERFSEMLRTIEERQAHTERALVLDMLSGDQEGLRDLLWAIESTAGVRLQNALISRSGADWTGTLSGVALAPTSSQAASAVQSLLDQLSELTNGGAELTKLSYLDMDGATADSLLLPSAVGSIAIDFQMSFIVTTPEDVNGETQTQ